MQQANTDLIWRLVEAGVDLADELRPVMIDLYSKASEQTMLLAIDHHGLPPEVATAVQHKLNAIYQDHAERS